MRMRYNAIVELRIEDYGMDFDNEAMALMVKCYLKSLPHKQAKRLMGNAINPKIVAFGFESKEAVPKVLWADVQCEVVAKLIDAAAKNCREELREWNGDTRLCRKTKRYIEEELIGKNPGEEYVKAMPYEFAEFLLDCYFKVRRE